MLVLLDAVDLHADNDPLNKTDPTGMRPTDEPFRDPCRHLAQEVDGDPGMYAGVGYFVENGNCGVSTMTGKSFFGTKPAEWLWLQNHPWYAKQVDRAANQAVDQAARFWASQPASWNYKAGYNEYQDRPPDGTTGNAYQHIIWNVLLREFMDEGDVKSLVQAHETEEQPDDAGDLQNPMFRQMDMANNFYGQQIARRWNGKAQSLTVYDSAVREFIGRGSACSRKPRPTDTGAFTGGFVDPGRCGLG